MNITVEDWRAELAKYDTTVPAWNRKEYTEEQKEFMHAVYQKFKNKQMTWSMIADLWFKYFGEKVHYETLSLRIKKFIENESEKS